MNFLIMFLLTLNCALAQLDRPSLKEVSQEVNRSLPQVYDHATKLVSTSVENNLANKGLIHHEK